MEEMYHIQRPYVSLFFWLTLTQIDLWVQNFFIACCLVCFAAFFQTHNVFRPNVNYDGKKLNQHWYMMQLMHWGMGFDFGIGPTCSYFGWRLRTTFNSNIFEKFSYPCPQWVFKNSKLKLGHIWERKSVKLYDRTVWQNSWFSQTKSHINEKVLFPSSVSVCKFSWSSKVGKGK